MDFGWLAADPASDSAWLVADPSSDSAWLAADAPADPFGDGDVAVEAATNGASDAATAAIQQSFHDIVLVGKASPGTTSDAKCDPKNTQERVRLDTTTSKN